MFNSFNCLDLHFYPLKHRLIKNTNNTSCNLEIVPHEIPNICYVQLQLIRLGTKEYLFRRCQYKLYKKLAIANKLMYQSNNSRVKR